MNVSKHVHAQFSAIENKKWNSLLIQISIWCNSTLPSFLSHSFFTYISWHYSYSNCAQSKEKKKKRKKKKERLYFWVTFWRLGCDSVRKANWWFHSKVTPIRYENLILMFENEIGLGLKPNFLLKCFFPHTHMEEKKSRLDVDILDWWRQTSNHRTAEEDIMTSFHWGEMSLHNPSSSLIMFFILFVWHQKHCILHVWKKIRTEVDR